MADATARIIVKSDTAEAIDGAKNLEDAYKSASDNIYKGFTIAGTALSAFAAAGTAAMYSFVTAASEAEASQMMLEHAVIDVSHGTQEQVTALQELAAQVMANGVLDDDAIVRGQAQLSTFGLQTQSVYDLTQSMADLAVNQYGVSAGGAELEASANMIAKALQGQFGALEKSGIRFSEAQQQMILYGTEAEKVTAIQEGFAQNLKYTNEVAAQTFEGAMANLENQFGSFQEELGAALIPTLLEFADLLKGVAEWLNSLDPATVEIVAKVLLFGTAVAAVAGPILVLIGMIPTIVAGFTALSAAATAAWIAVTGPVGLVIAAILAVIAVGYLIIANWDTIKQYAIVTWETIRDTVIIALDILWFNIKYFTGMFVDYLVTAWEGIKSFFQTVWDGIVFIFTFQFVLLDFLITSYFTLMSEFIMTVWNGIKDFFSTIWTTIKSIFDTTMTAIKTAFETVWNGIKTFFISVWEAMKSFVTSTMDTIVSMITGYYEALKGAFQFIWDGAVGVVTGAVSTVISTIKSMINGIISMVNSAIGGINKLASAASAIPGVKIPTIPEIPYLAEGGVVTSPTLAMIGEGNGPEAVIPLNKFGGGFGGNTYNFYGPVSSREVAMEYADLITKEFGFSNKMV